MRTFFADLTIGNGSTFRNKHYLDMRKIIIKKHRKDKSDRSAIPTFK